MSGEREELIRLVEELDQAEVRAVLAEVKDRSGTTDLEGHHSPQERLLEVDMKPMLATPRNSRCQD